MEHRKNNKDGYKRVFPMSLSEDDTFCHYCGRKATSELALHWDHVPALNVRIPEEYGVEFDIRKTLIRSCSECNSLASDIPHLDYLERHIWLKGSYLRRYKSVLVNANPEDKDEVVSITGKVTSLGFQELLTMLGFGLKSEELIKSPILNTKNKPSGRLIKFHISEHLTGSPHEIDEEDINDELLYSPQQQDDIKKQQLTTTFLRDFLLDEWLTGNKIQSAEMLREWIYLHPGRAFGLELRIEDVALVEGIFNNIVAQVQKLYRSEVQSEAFPPSNADAPPEYEESLEKKVDRPTECDELFESKVFDKRDTKTECKLQAYLETHKNKIIMAFMMAVEGKRYRSTVSKRVMNEEEFLIFIRNSGLDRKTFLSFMKDKSFRAYNVHIPNNPESFYNLRDEIW